MSLTAKEVTSKDMSYMLIPGLDKLEIMMQIYNPNQVTLSYILDVICRHTQISNETIQSKIKNEKIVEARRLFCFVAKIKTKHNLSEIGRWIKRDHATVLWQYNKMIDLIEIYPHIRKEVQGVIDSLTKF